MRRPIVTLTTAVGVAVLISPVLTATAVGRGGWEHVGVGATASTPSLNGTVSAVNTQNPGVVYVGGNFTSAGGNANAKRIARWNGSTWSALGNTPLSNGAVLAIAYNAGKVYAGGTFTNAGGNDDADYLAVWDGSTWAPFCNPTGPDPSFTANVSALQIIGNTLYVGGAFQNGAGIDSADYLVACDLTTGAASGTVIGDGDFSGAVYALTADSAGHLYAGGGFINLATIPEADHIAEYDGSWHAMGANPIDSFVRSLTASGTNVYVGTDSNNIAGIANADHVARWNGSSWSALGSDTAGTNGWFPSSSFIYGLTTYGSLVIAGGSFQNANGVAAADNIAYFDGSTWRPLGSDGAGNGPFIGQATALGVANGKVFLGGNFTTAGGDGLASFLATYALRQPDAAIGGAAAGPFVGNNVYSTTGAGEVRNVTVDRGDKTTAYVKVQNDGLTSAAFTLNGTGNANGMTVHYYRGSSNITTAVRAGTYSTGSIAARDDIVIRMVVNVANSSAAAGTFVTTVRSQTGTSPDAVRLAVKARG